MIKALHILPDKNHALPRNLWLPLPLLPDYRRVKDSLDGTDVIHHNGTVNRGRHNNRKEIPGRRNDMRRWKQIAIVIVIQLAFIACAPEVLPVEVPTQDFPLTDTPAPIRSGSGVISLSTAKDVILLQTFSGHTNRVLDVEFSAGGKYIASSSQDMTIKLWDVGSGKVVHSFQMRSVDMSDIDISLDSNLLASGEAIWDLDSLQEIHVLERGLPFPVSVAFSPDGSLLAVGIFDQQIKLWDPISGQPISTFEKREENRTKRMDFSPDGTLLAAGVIDGSIRLFDIASGKITSIFKYGGETDIHNLAFSPDGKYLASGGRFPAVVLWDIADGRVVRTFRLTDNAISMDFSPDGTILASAGGKEYEVLLWDVESGALLHSLPHNDQLTSIAISPDGRLLAVGCFDNKVYLWGLPPKP
jgi:WD40 repeat protein